MADARLAKSEHPPGRMRTEEVGALKLKGDRMRSPFRPVQPIRLNFERIAAIPRQDMQVDMENILKGGLPIGQKEVDPFTAQT